MDNEVISAMVSIGMVVASIGVVCWFISRIYK
jgi:hypothetical protein